ncbi:MAG: SDR family NAD(P)-dependent oxidoreductase, partial [Lachnospiraceae bacterium]|nr:SDR family NAD(P)-dependent oxidoreductase [Lachnospiraceae bacterium]
CAGLTSVTYMVLPYMVKNSRIINLASSSAFLPQPGFGVYAASKSYVLSFSRALRCEVKNRGISVTAVCPGPVATDFFSIAEGEQKRAWFKDLFMANASDVVDKAIKDSIEKKELSIYGISMKLFYLLTKLVPHRIILKIYSATLKS